MLVEQVIRLIDFLKDSLSGFISGMQIHVHVIHVMYRNIIQIIIMVFKTCLKEFSNSLF